MYAQLQKAKTELRIAQMAIENDEYLYAKLDDLMNEIEELSEEALDKEVK